MKKKILSYLLKINLNKSIYLLKIIFCLTFFFFFGLKPILSCLKTNKLAKGLPIEKRFKKKKKQKNKKPTSQRHGEGLIEVGLMNSGLSIRSNN